MYGVILAGGSGTRLWPLSRKKTPKQLLALWPGMGRTMLQETYSRLHPLIPPERILVVVAEIHEKQVIKQLPDLPRENLIVEPVGKGSASAMGLAAVNLQNRGAGDEVMAVLPADHFIRDEEKFRDYLLAAEEMAKKDYLVTFGIPPTRPERGYGYIHRGESIGEFAGHHAFHSQQFLEKPNEEAVRRFLDRGEYYWNSGIFAWRVSRIVQDIEQLMPDLYGSLQKITAALNTLQEKQVILENWLKLECQTIDYGIMEKADKVAVLPMEVGWSDVGSWASLLEILPADEQGNVVLGRHIGVSTHRSLIYGGERPIATIGVEDLIVVDTPYALLICPRDKAQEVKALVEKLAREGKEELL
ncbi:MAG: mannose-1-phosphate guanylyltransferase [Chloroflexi bacterium]|nr:mannose-1-phosphate guanylyltransferase [Chloroflexota bacterium]